MALLSVYKKKNIICHSQYNVGSRVVGYTSPQQWPGIYGTAYFSWNLQCLGCSCIWVFRRLVAMSCRTPLINHIWHHSVLINPNSLVTKIYLVTLKRFCVRVNDLRGNMLTFLICNFFAVYTINYNFPVTSTSLSSKNSKRKNRVRKAHLGVSSFVAHSLAILVLLPLSVWLDRCVECLKAADSRREDPNVQMELLWDENIKETTEWEPVWGVLGSFFSFIVSHRLALMPPCFLLCHPPQLWIYTRSLW